MNPLPVGIKNALTVDVEDYFHVTAFERQINPSSWDTYSLRVVENTEKILDMFDEHSVKATFFVLGWVAERRPDLVKEIGARGHEIACHGYGHQLVYRIGPDKFRSDIRTSKKILEDITGDAVIGYRAPSYSITRDSLWAFDILVEEGFQYDSSIFPIVHDIYGIPHANRFPHVMNVQAGRLHEFPLSTYQISIITRKISIPVAGGGYLRLFPAWFIQRAITSINTSEGQPAVLYFHPWEIDHEQPRIKTGMKSRFRHYLNLHKMSGRIQKLVSTINFSPMREILNIRV